MFTADLFGKNNIAYGSIFLGSAVLVYSVSRFYMREVLI